MLIKYVILVILINQCLSKEKQMCGYDMCNPEGGYCNKASICTCYPGYISYKSYEDHSKCNYKQVSSIKAGLIEMIIGCGFGHFYAGRKGNGTVKLTCVIILSLGCFISLYMIKKIREETEAEDHPYVSMFFLSLVIIKIIIVIWQLIDGILFFLEVYKDGNDLPLY